MATDMKRCSRCKETKPRSEFHRNKAQRDGHTNTCKPCMKVAMVGKEKSPRQRAYRAEWKRKNVDKVRDYAVKVRFGMPLGSYAKMSEAQEGRCAICRREPNAGMRLHVDHDHATGCVRGLLCPECNKAIGLLRDDVGSLARAIVYLSRPAKAATFKAGS